VFADSAYPEHLKAYIDENEYVTVGPHVPEYKALPLRAKPMWKTFLKGRCWFVYCVLSSKDRSLLDPDTLRLTLNMLNQYKTDASVIVQCNESNLATEFRNTIAAVPEVSTTVETASADGMIFTLSNYTPNINTGFPGPPIAREVSFVAVEEEEEGVEEEDIVYTPRQQNTPVEASGEDVVVTPPHYTAPRARRRSEREEAQARQLEEQMGHLSVEHTYPSVHRRRITQESESHRTDVEEVERVAAQYLQARKASRVEF
jgi:hypothetical protein